MKQRKAFTLVELLVVIAVIAVLMGILMPALSRVRDQARLVSCMANLRQWHLTLTMYAEDNEGKLFSGYGDTGFRWPLQLPKKLMDWKDNKLWFCPSAKTPETLGSGTKPPMLTAWGVFDKDAYADTANGIAGSYGLNGYFLQIPGTTYQTGESRTVGYRKFLEVKHGSTVPLFFDAMRFDLWPTENDAPKEDEFSDWNASSHMARAAMNRHRGFSGCVFADGAARKVGLKEYWTLQWHKEYNTAGKYTRAGGATADSWPDWMKPFSEY